MAQRPTRKWSVPAEVRRVISTASPDACVVRDGAGRPSAIVVPAGHPLFGDVCALLGADGPEQLAAVEQLAAFIREELVLVEGRASRYVLLRVDVLEQIYHAWCRESGRQPAVGEDFPDHLQCLGLKVAGGKLYGYALKDDALHDGFRRDPDGR